MPRSRGDTRTRRERSDENARRRCRRLPPRGQDVERPAGRRRGDRGRPDRDPARDAALRAGIRRRPSPRTRERRSGARSSTSGCPARPPPEHGGAGPSRSPSTVRTMRSADSRSRWSCSHSRSSVSPTTASGASGDLQSRLTEALRSPYALARQDGRDRPRRARPGTCSTRTTTSRPDDPGLEREAPRLLGGAAAARHRLPLPDRGARRGRARGRDLATATCSSRATATRR